MKRKGHTENSLCVLFLYVYNFFEDRKNSLPILVSAGSD